MAIETALSYPDISAQGFAHPADRAAAAALHAVPMLDRGIKKLSEVGYERKYRQLLLGNSVRLGEDQLPMSWALQRRCAHTFDLPSCPRLYVTQYPVGNALTIGTSEPMTLISSALAGSFDSDELHAVLAHELGHVLADHVGFTTAFQLLKLVMSRVLRGAPFAGLPLGALYYALLEWSRAAELTADRASALGTGDPLLTCRTLMRMAAGPLPGTLDCCWYIERPICTTGIALIFAQALLPAMASNCSRLRNMLE
jgi:Zn-dependent protease with chaperone function